MRKSKKYRSRSKELNRSLRQTDLVRKRKIWYKIHGIEYTEVVSLAAKNLDTLDRSLDLKRFELIYRSRLIQIWHDINQVREDYEQSKQE